MPKLKVTQRIVTRPPRTPPGTDRNSLRKMNYVQMIDVGCMMKPAASQQRLPLLPSLDVHPVNPVNAILLGIGNVQKMPELRRQSDVGVEMKPPRIAGAELQTPVDQGTLVEILAGRTP